MEIVFAKSTASVATEQGAQVPIRMGDHWPADDPIVVRNPALFSADPRYGLVFSDRPPGLDDPPVEQATAAPGEKRARVQRG